MALPKYKLSRSNTRSRRANWYKSLDVPQLTSCPKCHSKKISHQVCPYCGFYKGLQIVEIKERKKKAKK